MDGPPQAEPLIAVGAVVLDRSGHILLIRRGRAPNQGSWTLPGGRVEPRESLEDAVVRELLEETSLPVRVLAALCAVNLEGEGFAYVIHEHLVVSETDAVPRAGDDASDVRWVARQDLASLGVSETALEVIHQGLAAAHGLGFPQTP